MFRNMAIQGMAVLMAGAGLARDGEAQRPVTIVATGVGESAEVSTSIPVDERRPVIAKAWQQLGRLVQRKVDGSAKALHRSGGEETWVEWKNLRIVAVSDAGVSNADTAAGLTRRYYCEIASDAYRVWNPETISWSAWRAGSYEPFPWRVEVAWQGGVWVTHVEQEQDGQFIAPGGGGSRSGDAGIFRVSTDGSECRVTLQY